MNLHHGRGTSTSRNAKPTGSRLCNEFTSHSKTRKYHESETQNHAGEGGPLCASMRGFAGRRRRWPVQSDWIRGEARRSSEASLSALRGRCPGCSGWSWRPGPEAQSERFPLPRPEVPAARRAVEWGWWSGPVGGVLHSLAQLHFWHVLACYISLHPSTRRDRTVNRQSARRQSRQNEPSSLVGVRKAKATRTGAHLSASASPNFAVSSQSVPEKPQGTSSFNHLAFTD